MEQREEELKKRAELIDARLAEIEQMQPARSGKTRAYLRPAGRRGQRNAALAPGEALTHEKAMRISSFETQTKEDCDKLAQELITQAASRCAADHSSEITVSVVPLPSDEMKGRIIGREGRNIRARRQRPVWI